MIMKIAILQCDDVLEKFQQQFGHYPEMIRRMFQLCDNPFEFVDFWCSGAIISSVSKGIPNGTERTHEP